jgi:hypothetical protein
LDKCIRSSLSLFFSSSLSFSLFVVVCNNRENTAADGQHAFPSVHSFKRGGTHARSVHNDRTKGTQKKKRDVNLRHIYKKKKKWWESCTDGKRQRALYARTLTFVVYRKSATRVSSWCVFCVVPSEPSADHKLKNNFTHTQTMKKKEEGRRQ